MIEKGICFGDIHSYYDLGLVLSKTDIPPATPKTNYIDIPGGDGSIDLTEVHGDVKYNDRDCKFTFTVAKSIKECEWEDLKTKVNNALNGKTFNITLDKDPDYYYSGRCSINEYAVNKRLRQIIVAARVSPWKYKQTQTIITVDLTSTLRTIYLPNGKKPVCPIIECSKYIEVLVGNAWYYLSAGTHNLADHNFFIRLTEGNNPVVCKGSGTVKFIYQEGDL